MKLIESNIKETIDIKDFNLILKFCNVIDNQGNLLKVVMPKIVYNLFGNSFTLLQDYFIKPVCIKFKVNARCKEITLQEYVTFIFEKDVDLIELEISVI